MSTIEIVQGGDFNLEFIWTDENDDTINISGWSAHANLRPEPVSKQLIHSASLGSGIAIVGAAGKITLTIDADDTAKFNFSYCVMDVKLIAPDGTVQFLPEIKLKLRKTSTRDY